MVSTAQNKKGRPITITWKVATQLPGANGKSSIGVAGPINGVSNNVMIVAGGANFPQGMPWEGGKKFFSDKIHVLEKQGDELVWNRNVKNTLLAPLAYCGTTSTEKGIVCVGGENDNGISNKVFILKWNTSDKNVIIKPLPELPEALTNVALTHIGNVVYAAGGDMKNLSSDRFLSLDLNDKYSKWKSLTDLPLAVANASLIAQEGKLYLIGGRSKTLSGISELHHSTFVYDIDKRTWNKRADICDGKIISNLSAAAGIAIGKDYILMIGSDDGETFSKIESYISKISNANSPEEKAKLTEEKNALIIHHKGFSKKLLVYDIVSDCWTNIGEYPYPAQVTTTAVKWNGNIVVSNGEIKPGLRTPDIIVGKIK